MQDFIKNLNQLQNYLNNDVQDDIGVQAVKHFKQSFHNEAFTDKSEKDMPWAEVKRRQGKAKGAAATRKILTGETGDLGESISYEKQGRDVAITSPKVYAQVHNEGGKAGRGSGFTMKARPFIAQSAVLDVQMLKQITKRMNTIMNK